MTTRAYSDPLWTLPPDKRTKRGPKPKSKTGAEQAADELDSLGGVGSLYEDEDRNEQPPIRIHLDYFRVPVAGLANCVPTSGRAPYSKVHGPDIQRCHGQCVQHPLDECAGCGRPAIGYVAPPADLQAGYAHSISLCADCYAILLHLGDEDEDKDAEDAEDEGTAS